MRRRHPAHALLIDRNVQGARAAGLSALRYTGLGDLRYARAALGISATPPLM